MPLRPWIISLCLCVPIESFAAGFYLSEVGTPGSLGTAGVANPVNTFSADSAWTNPAGMTGVKQDSSLVGMQLLVPKIEFDADIAEAGGSNGGNAGEFASIPGYFHVKKLNETTSLGFAITAPLGGGADYGDDFVGRYVLTRAVLSGLGITGSVGYKVNERLSVGAGLTAVYTLYDQDIALNQPGALPDGSIHIDKIDDWGVQGVLGLTYQINDKTLLGVVYRSELDTELEGDLDFGNIQVPVLNQITSRIDEVEVEWTNPQWLEFGIRYDYSDKLKLMASGGWQEWSEFSQNTFTIGGDVNNPVVRVVDRDFDNTWYAGAAFVYVLGRDRAFSMGFSYDSSPVDDDDRTLDLPFDETYKLSASYAWRGEGKFDYALGGSLVYLGDASVDQTNQGVRVKGEYDTNLILFLGGTLRYEF
jgi:long-chain fatty acid transport protein